MNKKQLLLVAHAITHVQVTYINMYTLQYAMQCILYNHHIIKLS